MKNYGSFKIMPNCAICRAKLDKESFSLITKLEPKLTFHVTCSKCKTATLLSLSADQRGFMGIGVITDLDKNEAEEKLSYGSISADEMIEAYKMIKEIN